MVMPTGHVHRLPPMPPTNKKSDPPPELVKADKAYVEARKNKLTISMLLIRRAVSLAITEGRTIVRIHVNGWPDYVRQDVVTELESLHYKVRISGWCEPVLYIRFPDPKLDHSQQPLPDLEQ